MWNLSSEVLDTLVTDKAISNGAACLESSEKSLELWSMALGRA
jgi:hypothetical protein